jgi:hypothetical protein
MRLYLILTKYRLLKKHIETIFRVPGFVNCLGRDFGKISNLGIPH